MSSPCTCKDYWKIKCSLTALVVYVIINLIKKSWTEIHVNSIKPLSSHRNILCDKCKSLNAIECDPATLVKYLCL